jgi:hypothetical protein
MEFTFFVVSAKFTVQNQNTSKVKNYFVEVIVRYSPETDSNTAIAYLENTKRREGVQIFENFPVDVKEYILQGGTWRRCTIQELKILESQN